MQGKLFISICALALVNGVLSNVNPFTACARSCNVCNCLPTEPPTICSAQESEGILLPHEHCNQFYICNHGSKITFDCYGDLLFNSAIGQCDHAINVNCGDRVIPEKEDKNEGSDSGESNGNDAGNDSAENEVGDQGNNGSENTCNCSPAEAPSICSADGSEGTLVANEICNKYFLCNHGIPTTMSCPKGLLYNPYAEQCDWPHNVECGDRVIVEEEEEDKNENSENSNEDSNGDDNTEGSGNCNCNPDEAPLICSVEGSDGTLVANEICNKYFLCNHGIPTTMSCPKGLLYNPYTEQCDWPYNVECGDRVIVEEEEEDKNENSENSNEDSNGDDNTEGSGTCNCNPGEAPLICSVEGSDGTLVANEICNKYFLCNHGIPTTMNCPKGLLYNPYTEECDWPHNVECGDRVIVEEEEEDKNENSENSNEDSNGDDNTEGSGTCNCNTDEAPLICSVEGSDGTLVANEICNKYFLCNHGIPTTMNCPKGLLYNPYTEKCDWPHNVECGDRVIVEVEKEESSENGNENDNDVTTSDENNNGGNGTCNCNPAEAPSICSAEGSEGTLIAHEICCNFFVCVHGVPIAQTCPSGLLYNPYTEKCDWPQNVDCGDRVIVEVEEEESSEKSENSNENGNGVTASDENNTGDIGTCNCNPAEAPSICSAEGSDGTLIAHEVCCKFFVCGNRIPTVQSCPSGLLYNPYTEQCDWPHKVDCGERVLTEEEDNGGNGDEGSSDGNDEQVEPEIDLLEVAKATCADTQSAGQMVAHENCHQFYVCLEHEPVVLTCPVGLLYDHAKEVCEWPENVQCDSRILPA